MSISINNVIRYWRESLLDADLSALQLTPDNHVRISKNLLQDGTIDPQSLKTLLLKISPQDGQNITTGSDENIPVVVAPIVAVRKGWHSKARQQLHCPVLIPAQLSRQGQLEVDNDNITPWMPRVLLEPTSSDLILGNVDDLTRYLEENKLPTGNDECQGWHHLEEYAWNMFITVAGLGWKETFKVADYRLEEEAALFPISILRGVSNNILKVYDNLRVNDEYPPLLMTLGQLQSESPKEPIKEDEWAQPAKLHLGNFSNDFSLSLSQRQALHHFLTLPENSILAISGPPGTGKTTLLHSVIASLWVNAALKGGAPPVIVVSSTNNQAVTNVIESLGGSDNLKRWLPFEGFGLYLVNSPEKQVEAAGRGILTINRWDQGFPSKAQTMDFFVHAEAAYREAYQSHVQSCDLKSIDEIVTIIHEKLIEKAQVLGDGIDIAFRVREVQAEQDRLIEKFGSLKSASGQIENLLQETTKQLACWQMKNEAWEKVVAEESPLLKRLNILPGTKKKREAKRLLFLEQYLPETDRTMGDAQINRTILTELENFGGQVEALQQEFENIQTLPAELKELRVKWDAWRDKQNAPGVQIDQLFKFENGDGSANFACLFNWLDTTPRFELFEWATHYWEGRWLQTIMEKGLTDPGYKESQNWEAQEEKWRRYAMLTPCFVTTMHSGPSFFEYYDGKVHPLVDFINLLIIDEAGQVTPEVSGGMFALAKQALVVGDIQQIEPVWSVPQQVDRGNLQRFGLLDSQDKWESLHRKGLMAGSDSVMKMAQSVSPYQLPANEGARYERGMFLAEHRRCVPEVIAYCNELAYQGRLRPMRPAFLGYPWPHMGYVHVKGLSTKENGSRKNKREAQALVNWIAENRQKLETYYTQKRKRSVDIEDIIGIVTPFSAQKRTLQSLLSEKGISLSKVGTVHALQGGERPLVLFSPVYSSRDSASFFFDQGLNMLNVAVSRAKDSFLVFGDMDIFDPALLTPSGILARYLFAKEENEITGYQLPTRSDNGTCEKDVHLINTLNMHVATLSRAFERVKKQLVIISPYLRWRAIDADGLIQKTATAVNRGVKITIYVDDCFNEQLKLPSAAKAAVMLRESGAEIKICHNIHSKVICIDGDIFVEGSFNWLSAERNNSNYLRYETSIIYMGSRASEFIEDTISEIDSVVIE